MLKTYPAIFHREQDESYWVEFTNFSGGTQGDNFEEAMKNAHEMLVGVLATYIEEGIALPKPDNIELIEVTDGFTTLIQVNLLPYVRNNKTVRKNVTVPEWLVKLANKDNINYSEVLTSAFQVRVNI